MTAPSDVALRLESGLCALDVPRAQHVARVLMRFGELLLAENARTNLTGARDMEALVSAHFLDSLAPLAGMAVRGPVIDLGSGGGLPGIPVAVAWPRLRVVLVEPRAKRVAFLRAAVAALGLENVGVVQSSARGERAVQLTGTAGTALMRAVADAARSLALGLPFVRPGGVLVLYEGRAGRPTREARSVAASHGARIRVRQIRVPYLDAVRHAWYVTKRSPLMA